ncbi:MAG: hypothetical protein LBF90_03875 [Prevotellaceae bacterium]|jgi:hypothetical protein|nr:hypothetical protein [Prevotellaceae bacterium]
MPYNKSFLQQPDATFLANANNIDRQCTLHGAEWNLDANDLAELSTLTAGANTAYAANNQVETKNRTTSVAKKTAFAALKHFLGLFINTLEGSRYVPDEALELMGLRPRTHHANQPLPLPTDDPVVSILRHHDELVVYVARHEYDQPNATVAPERYHGFRLRWKFDGETEWRYVVSTRLHTILHFEQADRGRTVILAASWINPRLESGPYSNNQTEVIS